MIEDAKFKKIVDGMISHGMSPIEATAVMLAIEHSIDCPDFKTKYGNFMVKNLGDFVEKVSA